MRTEHSITLVVAAVAGAGVVLVTVPALGLDKASILGAMAMILLGSIIFA